VLIIELYCGSHSAERQDASYSKHDHVYIDKVEFIWDILVFTLWG